MTALMLEDDADWDIEIKKQLFLVAPHIRAITNSTSSRGQPQPYGSAWDLLWVGHCGDDVPQTGVVSIFDNTLPEDGAYRENTGEYIMLSPEPQRRLIHISEGPICTYAYAVTGSAARKIYEYAKGGVDDIITVYLRRWCRAGFLVCVTINPELFHHHKKAGKRSSEIAAWEGWEALSAPSEVEYTANIRYSARCNANSTVLVSCRHESGRVDA